MDCGLNAIRNGSWRELARIKSTPILASHHKLDLRSPCGIKWVVGSYAMEPDARCRRESLVTEEPSPPTGICEFELSIPDNRWILGLAKYSELLREDPGAPDLWVNPSVYNGIPQIKISEHPFPGSVKIDDDTYFGETVIPPLSMEHIALSSELPEPVRKGEPPSWPILLDGLEWRSASGYLYGEGDYRVIVHQRINMAVFINGVGELKLVTRYYRPRIVLLHPYIYIEQRLEEDTQIVSPLLSLYDPVNNYTTLVSREPISLNLKNGVATINASSTLLVARMPPHAALKTFYTLSADPVNVEGYKLTGGKGSSRVIASFRMGPSLVDSAVFSSGELTLRIFNPGIMEGYAEFKFNTKVEEGWIDDLYLEGLYDRIRAVIPSPFLGLLRIKLKRGLTSLLS